MNPHEVQALALLPMQYTGLWMGLRQSIEIICVTLLGQWPADVVLGRMHLETGAVRAKLAKECPCSSLQLFAMGRASCQITLATTWASSVLHGLREEANLIPRPCARATLSFQKFDGNNTPAVALIRSVLYNG